MEIVQKLKGMCVAMVLTLVNMIASINIPTPKTVKMEYGIRSKIEMLRSDNIGMVQMIGLLSGITLTITGFATLVLGNYIVYAIALSIPSLASTAYNTTRDSILSYVGIVMPLFGLVMMVGGFALILMSLGILNVITRQ